MTARPRPGQDEEDDTHANMVYSPVFQAAAMTAYIGVCAAIICLLYWLGVSPNVAGNVAVVAAAIGLGVTYLRVGAFSWAIATAFAWLGAAVLVISALG